MIGAWQRALSHNGLVGGHFYTIYNEQAANNIEDPALAERFKRKKDEDLAQITKRMDKVRIERAYRIANALEAIANDLTQQQIPTIQKAIKAWRTKTLLADAIVFTTLITVVSYVLSLFGAFDTPFTQWSLTQTLTQSFTYGLMSSLTILAMILGIHLYLRTKVVQWEATRLAKKTPNIAKALLYNNRFWHSLFSKNPRGWSKRTQKQLVEVVQASKQAIQKLNDQFANPSGQQKEECEK